MQGQIWQTVITEQDTEGKVDLMSHGDCLNAGKSQLHTAADVHKPQEASKTTHEEDAAMFRKGRSTRCAGLPIFDPADDDKHAASNSLAC